MQSSLFMRLSDQVKVADLMNLFQASVRADSRLAEAREHIERHEQGESAYSLVIDEGNVIGWVDESSLSASEEVSEEKEDDSTETVRDIMQAFAPARLLTADTPARRALPLIVEGDRFEPWFVLDRHEFIGTIDYDCFFKAPFKVCLFALAMQLEQRSLALCVKHADASWEALPEGRRTKAEEAIKRRREKHPFTTESKEADDVMWSGSEMMLGGTNFIDKKTIFRKLNLLPDADKAWIKQVFDWLENVRNCCAHPDFYEEPFTDGEDLVGGIMACESLLHEIEEQLLPPPPVEN